MAKQAQVIDLNTKRLAKQLREAYETYQAAENHEVKARELLNVKRLVLGQLLCEAREKFPARGRNASPWGDLLREVGINEDVALVAMKYAGYVEKHFPGQKKIAPGNLPSLEDAGLKKKRDPKDKANRGAWCTPEPIAKAVGAWDLDPFSNPRSHIKASRMCMLEQGDDGFGLGVGNPGSYRTTKHGVSYADTLCHVWLQPDYGFVLEALHHYCHTRFCALLRLDPSTEWFEYLHARSETILIPKGDRIEFDPPPGVEASSNPFPHGLFYARAKDATKEIRALCYEWRV